MARFTAHKAQEKKFQVTGTYRNFTRSTWGFYGSAAIQVRPGPHGSAHCCRCFSRLQWGSSSNCRGAKLMRLQAQSRDLEPTLRQRLRAETKLQHDAVEEAMSRWDLSDRYGYGAFLSIHRATLKRLAGRWRLEDRRDFEAMLHRIEADHAALDLPMWESAAADTPSANGIGVAYVVRGSRLGSRVLRRRVPEHFPATFLEHEPSLTWSEFLDQLSQCPGGGRADQAGVIAGARATFDLFGAVALEREEARL